MTIESCKRILWRIKEKFGLDRFNYYNIEWAIMEEVGTDPRTIRKYIATLLKMGWIQRTEKMMEFTATEKGKNE